MLLFLNILVAWWNQLLCLVNGTYMLGLHVSTETCASSSCDAAKFNKQQSFTRPDQEPGP